ncbi:hypothetical protein NP233_g5723 [Leucocoprinus birnbaumii]|uniref:Oligopeptide transporter n=1 Tax=Leucocoprinus birnbaumii TaxID=56174 RepID=A0AAD5VSP5_9AGAR|nr:hypothetical protein NP233_g5723 [Leucocoprinus birnbaumii]
MPAGQQDENAIAAIDEAKHVEAVDHEKRSLESRSGSNAEIEHELDGIHDGLEFPTEKEKRTLRRVADSIPWQVYMIALVQSAERFSFYGCLVVFTNYVQQPLPDGSRTGSAGFNGQAGALGMGQHASSSLAKFYQYWCYITPLFGAYIADAHWGRYKTICWAVLVILIGHILLIIAAIPGVIEHQSAIGAFIVAIIVMGFGTGLFKPNISPLVAEQYRRRKLFVVTIQDGERVIVDPVVTISRIYMYFYLFNIIGTFAGRISMTYSEKVKPKSHIHPSSKDLMLTLSPQKFVGFWLAYTLPTVVFLLCPLILWAGRKCYHTSPPTGSVLADSFRLFTYAARGRWSINPVRTYRNMTAADFWENAKPSSIEGEKPSWMTFDDRWVEEVRRGLKACRVFLWYPIYWLTYDQLNDNLISQAFTMATHGLPNDVLGNLYPFGLVVFIPICDFFIYPALRRAGLNFSALKRITLGFFTGAMAMVWAAVLQHYIYKTSPCGYRPKNMKSLVMAVFLFMPAIASAIGEAFDCTTASPLLVLPTYTLTSLSIFLSLAFSDDPLLVWNYGVMAVLAFTCGCVMWFFLWKLDSQEEELNYIAEAIMVDHKQGD